MSTPCEHGRAPQHGCVLPPIGEHRYCLVHHPDAPPMTWLCDICGAKFKTHRGAARHDSRHVAKGDFIRGVAA